MEILAIISRWTHFTAAMLLFGASLFPFYASPHTLLDKIQSEKLHRWLRGLSRIAAIVLLLSAFLWWMSVAMAMGGGWQYVADPETLRTVLFDTMFGKIWLVRILISLVIIVVIGLRSERQKTLQLTLSLFLLGSLGAVGHAVMFTGTTGAAHVTAQVAHLIAAGFWIGGFSPLAWVIRHAIQSGEKAWLDYAILSTRAFSRFGLFAVVLIFLSGSLMSVFLVQSWFFLFHSLYGQILLVKILLFGLMCGFALFNRTALMPNLSSRPLSRTQLLKNIIMEQVLGMGALVVVSVLGTLPPGFTQ